MPEDFAGQTPPVPPIVHIVLSQAARMRGEGVMTNAAFEEKISRLCREELEPRRLQLLRRELPGGRVRFVIKAAATGTVCETIDYSPAPLSHAA